MYKRELMGPSNEEVVDLPTAKAVSGAKRKIIDGPRFARDALAGAIGSAITLLTQWLF